MSRSVPAALEQDQLHVSARDQQIYHQVVVEQRKQSEVAEEHGISPARVSRIVQRVLRWLSELAPGMGKLTPAKQLSAAGRIYQLKLKYYEALAERAYMDSTTRETRTQVFELVRGRKGQGMVPSEKGKLYIRTAKADLTCLKAAETFARRQAEFLGPLEDAAIASGAGGGLNGMPDDVSDEELEERIQLGEKAAKLKRQWELDKQRREERSNTRAKARAENLDSRSEISNTGSEASDSSAEISISSSEISNLKSEVADSQSANTSSVTDAEGPPAGLAISATPEVGLERENTHESDFVDRATSGAEPPPSEAAGENQGPGTECVEPRRLPAARNSKRPFPRAGIQPSEVSTYNPRSPLTGKLSSHG